MTHGEVMHRACLLSDLIKMADHLMTESDAPKHITDLSVSLIMVARDMSENLVNELDSLQQPTK